MRLNMFSKKTETDKAHSAEPMRLDDYSRNLWQGISELSAPVEAASGQEIAPKIRIWYDDEEGEQNVTCQKAEETALVITAQVHRPGRWLGLHFALGRWDFSGSNVFGVYAQSQAARALSWRTCLRSGRPDGDGFVDHFGPKYGVSYAAPSAHMDLLDLDGLADFPVQAPWREFIIFFNVESFEVTLKDLRLFCA